MASASSKALPYVSIAMALVMAILSSMGYQEQIDQVVGFLYVVLPITAGGGLINEAIKASVEKKKVLLGANSPAEFIQLVVAEVNKAKTSETSSTPK